MSQLTLTSTGARYVYLPVASTDPTTDLQVDLSSGVFKAALVRPNDRPDTGDWVAATHVGTGLVAGRTYDLARVLIGTGGAITPKPGEYSLWVQVAIGAETIEEHCGRVRVL